MISIQQFVAASASADRVLISTNDSGEPVVTAAKYSLQDKAVMFLSNIPIIKNTDFVQNYIEKLNSDNAAATGVFLNALSKCYGATAATSAAESLRKSDAPLDARAVRQMSEIAENIHGRGDAKNTNRQVVVRIWPQKSMEHVGHASVTIKNLDAYHRGRPVNEHVSWWPGADRAGSPKNRYLSERPAVTISDYRRDKELEISDRTAQRLELGAQARKELKAGSSSPVLLARSKFEPRVGQNVTKGGSWGVSAHKIYMPMVGKTKDAVTGQKSFVMFGLNEKRILADARQVKSDAAEGKIGYTLASKTQNCAAMAARMLKSGGSENFAKFQTALISEGPNSVHAYAKLVQAEMDTLNRKSNNVEKRFADSMQDEKFKEKYDGVKLSLLSDQSELDVLEQRQKGTRDPEEHRQIDTEIRAKIDTQVAEISRQASKTDVSESNVAGAARDAIVANAPSAQDDFDTLTLKAKNIVNAMDVFLGQSPELHSDLDMTTLLLGRTMLDKVRDFMRVDN